MIKSELQSTAIEYIIARLLYCENKIYNLFSKGSLSDNLDRRPQKSCPAIWGNVEYNISFIHHWFTAHESFNARATNEASLYVVNNVRCVWASLITNTY